MTTRDGTGGGLVGLPAESRPAEAFAPALAPAALASPPTAGAPARLPTPGISPAAARMPPTGPTLPEWDPVTLAAVVQRLASDLFQEPPPPPDASFPAGVSDGSAMPALPGGIAATEAVSPPGAPVRAASPAPPAPSPGSTAPAPVPAAVPAVSVKTEDAPSSRTVAASPFFAPLALDQLFHLPAQSPGDRGPLDRPDLGLAFPLSVPLLDAVVPGPIEHAAAPALAWLPPLPGSAVSGSAVPGSAVPGSAVPGSAVPGSAVPGSPMPGLPTAGPQVHVPPLPAPIEPTISPVRDAPDAAVRSSDTAATAGQSVPEASSPWPDSRLLDAGGASAAAPGGGSFDALPFEAPPGGALAALPVASAGGTPFDPYALRREFPILEERVHGRRLVWLDNAATTQKPRAVIDRLVHFYHHENSNVHRAAHTLAARATDAYEGARETVRRFLGASSTREIVFVRGATEGINLVAQSWGRRHVQAGDEILITWLEHHANIVPWQMLCQERGARLRVAPVDDRGQVRLDEYERLLGPRTRLVALSQVSNALGTVTPAREMVELAHRHGATVLVDGAQAVSHLAVQVQALDCDFYVFSGHKVFAPTGIGVVYGKSRVLDETPPWQGGGNMIQDVTFERTLYQPPPGRFEAGTGSIADAVGLGAALDWLMRVGVETVGRYEHELLDYATSCLRTVPGLRLIGTAPDKAGVISFVLAGQKTEEVGGLLDREGIAVRSGHHCAQPILRRFGLEATVRASLAPYNTREDIDALTDALHRLQAGR